VIRPARSGDAAVVVDFVNMAMGELGDIPAAARRDLINGITLHGTRGIPVKHSTKWAKFLIDEGDFHDVHGLVAAGPAVSFTKPLPRPHRDRVDGSIWEVTALAVYEEHRGTGCGTLLLDAIEGVVAAEGGVVMLASVNGADRALLAWYRRRGWRVAAPGFEIVIITGGVTLFGGASRRYPGHMMLVKAVEDRARVRADVVSRTVTVIDRAEAQAQAAWTEADPEGRGPGLLDVAALIGGA
jgi:ribosomal protein S18 acetylase RimI-like enzyme